MFWARTKAVYQIFNNKIIKLAPKEKGQLDKTILHAIERLWLYLVKINGFYYKTFIYYI
jgi:lipopolysaccharide biosynthesis protein